MGKSRINDYIQTGASVGVIVSLVFVGLEIQQSREIAVADIHQQRTAMAIQTIQGTYSTERYGEAIGKLLAGEEVSAVEETLILYVLNTWFAYWENVYFQFQLGLLQDVSWESSRRTIKNRFRRQLYQEWWEENRIFWNDAFAVEVDAILAEVRAGR
jgi:hypothetical protein